MRKLTITGLFVLASATAHAQEDLLWKVENTSSPTTVPLYQQTPTPFTVKARQAGAPASDDKGREKMAEEARAALAAAQEAERLRREQATAEAKARKLLSKSDLVIADLNGVTVEGVVQGPLGSSMLWQGKWLPQGTQLKVPVTLNPSVSKQLEQWQQTDSLAAQFATTALDKRLQQQPSISVTLVKIASESVIFTDGRQRYQLKVSQPPF